VVQVVTGSIPVSHPNNFFIIDIFISMEKVTITKEQLFKAMKINEQKGEEAKTGSSKSPKIYSLPDKTIKILTDRIKDEYTAHYYYRAATNWCADMNYKKAAAFFENEAKDELEHAETLQKYMTDFNIIPEIPTAKISHSFTSLEEIINGAYEMELGLMKAYNKDSQTLFDDDITTFDVLTKLRKIQKGAVIEYNDLINGLSLVDSKDKFQVLYFEQTYF
jgi:ferritin